MQVEKINTDTQLNRNSQSLFLLKRFDNSSTCGSVQVNFSPIPINLDQGVPLDVEKDVVKSFPIFNADKRFYTPTFILEVDKNKYTENQAIYYELHSKKIEELCQQKICMFVPKPTKNNSVCCICKVVYEDFLTHVTNPQHTTALHNSEFSYQIHNLCLKFTGKMESDIIKLQQACLKNKKIKKEPVRTKSRMTTFKNKSKQPK